MEARYPSIGEASPAEIFAAYKDLPQAPGGLDILKRIVQQNQNTGNMRGSIATSILNDAISAQPVPPMPQGTVSGNVVAQATPPAPMPLMDPNMAGLAAPGLEQMAQQRAATGGLVALAQGGEVPGYAKGGASWYDYPASSWPSMALEAAGRGAETLSRGAESIDLPEDWLTKPVLHMSGYESPEQYYSTTEPSPSKRRELEAAGYDLTAPKAEEVSFAKETKPSKESGSSITPSILGGRESSPWDLSGETKATPIDYAPGIPSAAGPSAQPTVVVDTDEGIPAAKAPEEKTAGGTSSRVPTLTAEQQIAQFAQLFNGDHSKAAELKGQMEKRLASKENKDLITDIATGLGAMFSGQGTKTQAAGAGLMAFAAQHGRSGEGHDKLQATIDAMNLQEEAQQNAAMQAAIKQVYGTQAKMAETEAEHRNRMKEIAETGRWHEAYGYARAGEKGPKGALRDVDFANMQKDATDLAIKEAGPKWLAMTGPQQQAAIDRHYQSMLRSIPGGGRTMSGAPVPTAIPRVKYTPPAA